MHQVNTFTKNVPQILHSFDHTRRQISLNKKQKRKKKKKKIQNKNRNNGSKRMHSEKKETRLLATRGSHSLETIYIEF